MNDKKLLCASMMCADFGNLKNEITLLEDSGIDIFHLDIMDGIFVSNFGIGLQDVEYICQNAKILCDVHLMISHPIQYVEKFAKLGAQIIYIHPETDPHACRTLQKIKNCGAFAGIAINPGTSFETIQDLLYLCDYVLFMSVNPGFAGQKYLNFTTTKLTKLIQEAENYNGYKVIVDGACSPEVIKVLSKKGVDGFVLGTSALFGKENSYKDICQHLRTII